MVSFGPKFKIKLYFNIYLGICSVMLGLALPDLLPVDVVQPWFALPLAPPPQPCFFVFAPELKTERNHIIGTIKNV